MSYKLTHNKHLNSSKAEVCYICKYNVILPLLPSTNYLVLF